MQNSGDTNGLIHHLERFLNMRYLTRYGELDYLAEVMINKMNRSDQKEKDGLQNEIVQAFMSIRTETGDSLNELDELLRTIQ